MSFREQKKYLEALKHYEKKFDEKEKYDFKMLIKRHKDEEELDKLSLSRLASMYEKYHLNREKKNYDIFFHKPDESNENINDE